MSGKCADNTFARILVADTDDETMATYRAICGAESWHLDEVRDGASLLAALAKSRYDIILANVELPDISAFDLIKRVRDQCPGQAILVVSDGTGVSKQLLEGANWAEQVLHKPFESNGLRSAINNSLLESQKDANRSDYFNYVESWSQTFSATSEEMLDLIIPLEIIDRLEAAGRIDRSASGRLHMAFQEAVNNALEHGNLELLSIWRDECDSEGLDRYAREKKTRAILEPYRARRIEISLSLIGSMLTIVIRDQGKGFVPPARPPPLPRDLTQVHGRGLALMYEVMDQVQYRDGGRELLMSKKI